MSLYYAEMLGTAVFAVTGVLVVIRRGLVRDVLAGRQTLLMSREIYASPILLGCAVFVALRGVVPQAGAIGVAVVFGLRGLAILRHLEMPGWLTHREHL